MVPFQVPTMGDITFRLTVSPAYEHSPHWSPDGKWIAFSANREGNDDVYIIPSEGGQSQQLTYHESDDQVCDWTINSRAVIFSSRRDDRYADLSMLYMVPFTGGTPVPIMEEYGTEAAFSPDVGKLLYTTNGTPWWRRHYRGSGSPQVWLYDPETGQHLAVTDTSRLETGEDYLRPPSRSPMWGRNGAMYVVSEPEGTPNIYKRETDGSWKPVTNYSGDGVRSPSISRDGRVIAYEYGLGIYIIEGEGEPRSLRIVAPLDVPEMTTQQILYKDSAERLAFTPDGRQMFIEVRGEVFAGRIVGDEDENARGRANPVSGDNPARDGDFTVSPGGDSLIFISDRSGNRDLYLAFSSDPDTPELARAFSFKVERITNNPADEHSPQWSPDGNRVAYIRGKGDLVIRELETGKVQVLVSGWSMEQYAWSPDSKWIAYAREDDNYNSDMFIIPADGGNPVNVSRHPDEDDFPVWSEDGRKLAFRSRREKNELNLHMVFLRLEDHYKTSADWAEEDREKKSSGKDGKDEDKDKKNKKDEEIKLEVVIDTTEIYRRIRLVTGLAEEEKGQFAISPDGRKYAYVSDHQGDRDLYLMDGRSKDITRLTKGGENPRFISFAEDGKRVRFLAGPGRIKSVNTEGKKGENHPFEARVNVQWKAERQQKFDEIWRTLNDRFYDSDFHGHDWRATGDKYRSMIDAASCEHDFGDLVKMMFGEINSSHMGYWSPSFGHNYATGRLGLDFDFADEGIGLLVKHILPHSPCARVEEPVKVGERLVAVNGVKLEAGVNLHGLLQDQVNQRVELLITDGKGKNERRIIVRPVGARMHGWLRYDEWVSDKRVMVDSLSEGRLGYLHLRGMGDPSLSRFEAQLFSLAEGKDGLVIDVRYNGGGWTTDYVLAMLQAKRHAVTFPRDGGSGYPQGRLPLYSWTKPIVVLCNERSFSNAEIFSHSIQTLERGKLVGVPTPGGVISTSGMGLLDGSGFNIPLRGWYRGTEPVRDSKRCLEGNGAVPDRIITLTPEQIATGDGRQLNGAVEELLQELNTGDLDWDTE